MAFGAEPLETMLITPPAGSLPARKVLFVGLGPRSGLNLDLLKKAGAVMLREIVRTGLTDVSYAPMIRDQGVTNFSTHDVAQAVFSGFLKAYDTELKLAAWSHIETPALKNFNVLAGPAYHAQTSQALNETVEAVTCKISPSKN